MVSPSEILDIVEIAYFGPAFFVTLYICYKQGFSREAGWILLSILSLVRLLGGSLGIASTKTPTTGLITAYLILNSIGSTVLVAGYTGIVNRIETGSRQSPFPLRARKLLQLVGIAAIVMGSLGGSAVANSDPDTRQSGYTYIKVSVILIFVQFLAATVILLFSAMNIRRVLDSDRRLFFFTSLAAPFVLIRIIYSLSAAFNPTSKNLSSRSSTTTAVIIRAFLGVAMEIIAVTLLATGGLVSPKMQKEEQVPRHSQTSNEQYVPVDMQHLKPVVQQGHY